MPLSPPPLALSSLHFFFIDVLHLENYYNVDEHIGVLFIMFLPLLIAFIDGIPSSTFNNILSNIRKYHFDDYWDPLNVKGLISSHLEFNGPIWF
jgi:hypothetical protein